MAKKQISLQLQCKFRTIVSEVSFFVSNPVGQTMNSVGSKRLRLKYQRFTSSGCKDIGIRKFEFVAKNHFLSTISTF